MITHLGKFLPNLSKETAPLRQLLEKDVQWHFKHQHETAVNTLKKIITSSPVLAVLEQNHEGDWKPIAYASKAMTQCEQHYTQIEKETLAIVFACERFHDYTYGRQVIVRSDHKPIKAIFTKPLNKAPPRIQRFLLRLQKYDLQVNFTPRSEIPMADTLSRAYLTKDLKPEIPEQLEIRCHVHSIDVRGETRGEKLQRMKTSRSLSYSFEKGGQMTRRQHQMQSSRI